MLIAGLAREEILMLKAAGLGWGLEAMVNEGWVNGTCSSDCVVASCCVLGLISRELGVESNIWELDWERIGAGEESPSAVVVGAGVTEPRGVEATGVVEARLTESPKELEDWANFATDVKFVVLGTGSGGFWGNTSSSSSSSSKTSWRLRIVAAAAAAAGGATEAEESLERAPNLFGNIRSKGIGERALKYTV